MAIIKKAVTISFTITVLLVLSSICLVEGYSTQYTGFGNVERVKNAISFMVNDGYTIQLSNVNSSNLSDTSTLEKYLPHNTAVLFDILNITNTQYGQIFTAVVYLKHDDSSYLNLNKAILKESQYQFLFDNGSITPYTWNELVAKESLTNNINSVDLSRFEENRASLINTYNSQTLAHAGYMVTITITIAALFLKLPSPNKLETIFGKKNPNRVVFFTFLFLTALFVFFLYRLIFWSWMSSAVLGVTPQEAIDQGTPTLASGIQDHLTNLYKEGYLKTIPNLFYLINNYFFLSSTLVILPILAFVSQYFTNLITIKTRANTQLKYVLSVAVIIIISLSVASPLVGTGFPYSLVTIALLDILCAFIYLKYLRQGKAKSKDTNTNPTKFTTLK